MNVTMDKIDNVNAIITVSIEENDYQDKVAKDLKTIGLKHKIDGFRPGKVPTGILKKMFGKQALLDVINRETYEGLTKYISENNLHILGEPIIQPTGSIDWDNDKDFKFTFEVGFAPEINVKLDKDVHVPFYSIDVDEEMVGKQIEAFSQRFGAQVPGEEVDQKALVKGPMIELNEDGTPKEGGVVVAGGIVSPEYFKSDDERAKFIGKKVGEKVVFNPWNTCNGNPAEMASMLNVSKDNADNKSNFEMEISEIIVLKPAELNQELFDNVFGKDAVHNEEEYKAKIKEMIASQLVNDSNYRFSIDAEKVVMDQVGNLELPKEFLKKWLLLQNDKKTGEEIEADFDKMIPSLQWQLVKDIILKNNDVKIEESDLLSVAKTIAIQQFAQYGMTNVPQDTIERYAQEIVSNKDYRKNIADKAVEDKLFSTIKEKVTLDEKTVSAQDFNALFEK